jgi:putative FmdB family regulatory protein
VPLYDFACRSCGERFEARTDTEGSAACPACGAPDAERLLAPFAGPFTTGRLRGVAARRSEAARRNREEQRLERREARKNQGK